MENKQNIIIYKTPNGNSNVSLYAKDGNIWMNQNQLSDLFATSKQNISLHIVNILKDKELDENSVVKDYLTTALDGKDYNVTFYSLDMILAIGFRVRSKTGTQFRIWANKNLKQYMVKGYVIDNHRLKNPDGRPDYFDELLEQIRDIRASEKRFYQKVKDLFQLSSDYDNTDKATQMFFAQTQNKLLFAVTNKTAAELIVSRAKPNKKNMGLTSWEGAIARKKDIYIAKNYLTNDEIDTLNRLVVIFLESAELRVKDRIDITMDFWKQNVNKIIEFQDKKILRNLGSISSEQMKKRVKEVYKKFDSKRKVHQAELADKQDIEDLKQIEETIKKIK